MDARHLQLGMYAAGFAALVFGLQKIEKKKTPDGSKDWGQGLEPSRENPGGGDPIIPKTDPTDPTTSKDPAWETTVDPFPSKPFCAINLSFRNPVPTPQHPSVHYGYPGEISWAPEMSSFTQETCMPVQDVVGYVSNPDGTRKPYAPVPESVTAARKYTGWSPTEDELYTWQTIAFERPGYLMNMAETLWYDPATQLCSVPSGDGAYVTGPCGNWMQVPAGTPNEWKQWAPN